MQGKVLPETTDEHRYNPVGDQRCNTNHCFNRVMTKDFFSTADCSSTVSRLHDVIHHHPAFPDLSHELCDLHVLGMMYIESKVILIGEFRDQRHVVGGI